MDRPTLDVLQEIPDAELEELAELYRNETKAPYVFNFIKTAQQWKIKAPNSKYLTFFAPNGNWKNKGTFIALAELGTYNILVFSKEENSDEIYNALFKTKRLKYYQNRTIFEKVHHVHLSIVKIAVEDLKIKVAVEYDLNFWWMSRENALSLQIEIPDSVYIKQLEKEHISLINQHWPHKHDSSETYFMIAMTMEKSFGLFLKENDELAAWAFKTYAGSLGTIQTKEKYYRRGYASLLTLYLAKEVAEEGLTPLAGILAQNMVSQSMFKKCGFEKGDKYTFIICEKTE